MFYMAYKTQKIESRCKMAILITGGAGYIGSHTAVMLLEKGFDIVICDNFSNSSNDVIEKIKKITGKDFNFYNIDLRSKSDIDYLFQTEKIDSVIHFAALKAVGESVQKPLYYYENNLCSTINLLQIMDNHHVKNLIFSSSATVYGDKAIPPYKEDSETSATNPYGQSKIMIERMLEDLHHSDDSWNIISLRYFNPLGAHSSGLIGENPQGIPNNLLPYIAQVASGKLPELKVFGNDYDTPDGTGIRDYIHVCDLAEGHIKALMKLKESPGYDVYNLGTGKGASVLELISAFENANGIKIPYTITERRPGDTPLSIADVEKAEKELDFKAARTLQDMCRDTWNFQKSL